MQFYPWLAAHVTLCHALSVLAKFYRCHFLMFSYSLPIMNWIFVFCSAHFSLLPSVDLGGKWQPINM